MSDKREALLKAPLVGEALTEALVGIGMLFAATASADPNIEDTLFATAWQVKRDWGFLHS